MKAKHNKNLEEKVKAWVESFYPRVEILVRTDG